MCNTKFQQLTKAANNAKSEVKALSIMYYVNQLNKLARKNEYCESTNVRELGNLVRTFCKDSNIDLKNGDFFSAYLFDKINGVSYYKITTHKKQSSAFAINIDIVTYKAVTLSLPGVINAFKAVLAPTAKAEDKAAKAAAAAARKTESSAKAAARKALKAEQKAAIIAFNSGKMCAEEFANIMTKAI